MSLFGKHDLDSDDPRVRLEAVKAVHDMRLRLSQAENEHEALKSRFFSASKESQRIRLRPQLDSKAFQVSQLKQELNTDCLGVAQRAKTEDWAKRHF